MADSTPLIAFLAERDVACPGCGYNLRGLQTPECPECGRAFGPPDMRRAMRKPPRRPWVVLAAGIVSHLLLCGVLTAVIFRSRNADALWAVALWVPVQWMVGLGGALLVLWTLARAKRGDAAHLVARWGWGLLIAAALAVIAFPILAVV